MSDKISGESPPSKSAMASPHSPLDSDPSEDSYAMKHMSDASDSSAEKHELDDSVETKCRKVVSEFEDRYGIVLPYFGNFKFEVDPQNYKPETDSDCDTDEEIDANEVANPGVVLTRYVNQIRQSFGFDLDCVAPSWFNGSLFPLDLVKYREKYKKYYANTVKQAEFAISEINAELSGDTGECYELVEIEKVVEARNWLVLMTLKVKEKGSDDEEEDGNNNNKGDDGFKTIQAIVHEGRKYVLNLEQWRFKPKPQSADEDA